MELLFTGADGSGPNSLGSQYSEALRELSMPWPPGDRVKAAIARAARLADLSYWRAFDIYYRKARRIDAHEAFQISEALRLKREKEVQNEYQELRIRLAKLEAVMATKHSNFDRASAHSMQPRLR